MDGNQSRQSAATRKRRSSILKNQRPPRTPFSELEFNVATPTDAGKSRRVSFSRRTGVAEFATNEATTSWKNFYEEQNRSLETSGQDHDPNQPRSSMGSLGKLLFDQQFQDVEGEIDIVGGLGPMHVLNIETSMNNVNITQQIAMLDATSNDKFTAPHKNFELSAFTENTQGKIFKDDLTNPVIDDASLRIDINFSKLGSNRSGNDDLDEIDRYLDASRPHIVGPSFGDCSQYIEVDLNMTNVHMVPTNDSDMSITETIHSPKKELSKSLSVANKSNEDWVVDKENIVVNPYVTPAESDNYAINEESEKVLLFDGKKLKYANIDADIDDVVENKPSNKSLLNKTSQNDIVDMSFTKAVPTLKRQTVVFDKDDLDADISMTQCINNPLQIGEVMNDKEKRQTIVFDQNNEDADISMTQCIVNVAQIQSQNTGNPKRQTIVFDNNDIDADISMTQCIANPVVNNLNSESNAKRQTIVFDRDNIDADISMTACIPQQIVNNQAPEDSNPTSNKRQTIVFDTDDGKGDLSMTQCIRNNVSHFVDLVTHPFSKAAKDGDSLSQSPDEKTESKRQTIHFADDNCDISMTQCIPNDLISNISKVVAGERTQPALDVDSNDDYNNLSVTQCVSKRMMDSHNVEIPVYPVSIVFEKDEKPEINEANKSNAETKTQPPNNEEDQRSVTDTNSGNYQDCEKISSEEFLDFNAEDAVKDNNKWPETGFFYDRKSKLPLSGSNKSMNLDEKPQEKPQSTSASINECSEKEAAECDGIEEDKDFHMMETEELGQTLANDAQNITVNFSLLKSGKKSSKRDQPHIDLTNMPIQEEETSSSKNIELVKPEETLSETSAVAEQPKLEENKEIEIGSARRKSMLNDLLKMSSNDLHDVTSKSSANESLPNQSSNMLMILRDSVESNVNAETASALPKSAGLSETGTIDSNVIVLKDADNPHKFESETNSPIKTSLHQLSADSNLSKTIILKKESSSVDTSSVASNNYASFETKEHVKKFADEALQIGKSLSDISSDYIEKKEFGVYINSEIIYRETYNSDNVILAALKMNEKEKLQSSTSDASRMSSKKGSSKSGSPRSSVLSIADDVSKRKTLQEALKIHGNLDEVIPESATSVPKKKIVRMCDNIRKTLNFEDDHNESLGHSSKTIKSALKKTAFGETSYIREDYKLKVIPNFEVTDNVKEIMKDLVQPMADVAHRDVQSKPSMTNTEIQANLLSSSQLEMSVDLSSPDSNIDMLMQKLVEDASSTMRSKDLESSSGNAMDQNPEGFRSPRKELSQRVRFESDDDKQIIPPLDTVLIFDPQNPLNNILLSRGYTEVHKYNPKRSITSLNLNKDGEGEEKLSDCEHMDQQMESERASHESMPPKDEDNMRSPETFLVTEIRDSEVNTRIAMKGNSKLLKENASLANISVNSHRLTDIESVTEIMTDTNVENEESDIDAKTRKRSYSPDKNAEVKTPKPANKAPKHTKSPLSKIMPHKHKKSPKQIEPIDIVTSPANSKTGKVSLQEIKDDTIIVDDTLPNLRKYKDIDDLQFDESNKSPPGRRKSKQKKSTKIKLPNTDISVNQLIVEMSSPHQKNYALEQFLSENGFDNKAHPPSRNSRKPSPASRTPSPDSKNTSLARKKSPATSRTSFIKDFMPLQDETLKSIQDLTMKSTGDVNSMDQESQWNPMLPSKMQHILDEISYNVITKIDKLGFMGTRICSWDSTGPPDSLSFLLLHKKLRLRATLAPGSRSKPDVVRADAKLTGVHLEKVSDDHCLASDTTTVLASLCVEYATAAIRDQVSRSEAETAGDMVPLLRRCGNIARVTSRWGRGMQDAYYRLAYSLDSKGHLTLKVANIPLHSVWEISLRIEATSNCAGIYPRAVDVEVRTIVSRYTIEPAEAQCCIANVAADWCHVPRVMWKLFKYLKHRKAEVPLLLKA